MMPIRLEMNNFKSHTNSVIEFAFSSALIVGERDGDLRRSNGAGKSSVLEAISFALYSQTGDKNSDDIVKIGELNCEVILDFEHDSSLYQIKRIRNSKYSRVTTEFYKIVDGKSQRLHGDTNKITDTNIIDIIGCSYEVFMNSAYFRQGSFSDFAQGTFSTRQGLFSSMLNLDPWNKYQKAAKLKFDQATAKIEVIREGLASTDTVETQLEELRREYAETVRAIQSVKERISHEEGRAAELEKAFISSSEAIKGASNKRNLASAIAELGESIKRKATLAGSALKTKSELELQLAERKAAISRLSEEIQAVQATVSAANMDILGDEIAKMEDAVMTGRAKEMTLSKQIEDLGSGDACITCGYEWDNADVRLVEIAKRESELDVLRERLARASAKLSDVRDRKKALLATEKALAEKASQLRATEDSISLLKLRVTSTIEQVEGIEAESAGLADRLKTAQAAYEALADIPDDIDAEHASRGLGDARRALREHNSQLNTLLVNSGGLSAGITALEKRAVERQEMISKVSEYTIQATIYGRLSKAFGKDGIQAIIIDNVVDELSRLANNYLSEFSSEKMTVEFVTQKQSTKGDWKETFDIEINKGRGKQPFASLSGGEKFLVSFAIRLALSSVQGKRMGGETQIILLDEVSSSLDPYNIDVFMSIVRALEKTIKVLVITHDPGLKDEFENIITVRKTESGSTITQN